MEEYRPIARLSDEVIGMIAAGEVVENPASAVKEMIENSLDAGATSVTVEIRDGGVSYMRVSDNGRGIRRKDIRMAFERHATSKIRDERDLYDLHTLGFRGEALASIAAVAKVTLTTSAAEETGGIRAVNEGGEFKEITDAASPKGTTIVVRDLFYNTPVRLKFLKKANTEAGKVSLHPRQAGHFLPLHQQRQAGVRFFRKRRPQKRGFQHIRQGYRKQRRPCPCGRRRLRQRLCGHRGRGEDQPEQADVYRQRKEHPQHAAFAGAGSGLPRAGHDRPLPDLRPSDRDAGDNGGCQRAPQ